MRLRIRCRVMWTSIRRRVVWSAIDDYKVNPVWRDIYATNPARREVQQHQDRWQHYVTSMYVIDQITGVAPLRLIDSASLSVSV